MRDRLQVCDWDAGVFENHARPHLAEGGGDFRLEARKGREDVTVNGILISSFDPNGLTGPQRVITGITLLDSLLEERRRIRIDDDCRPCLEVIHSFPDLHWVVVKQSRIHGHEAQMAPGLPRRDHSLGGLNDQWTD